MKVKKEANRITVEEDGQDVGIIDFPENEDGTVTVTHTVVRPGYEGKGIAAELVREFADEMRERGKKARLTCSYAIAWFERNKEYDDVVAEKKD